MSGFVYFVRCLDRVKIGYSQHPQKRFGKINNDAPAKCELLGFVSADDFAEAELHKRFEDLRVHGEWFLTSASLLAFIETVRIKHRGKRMPKDRFERANLDGASPLKVWRYSQKLNGGAAAKLLGVTAVCWSQWENGSTIPSPSRLTDLERVTSIPAAVLRPDLAAMFGSAAAHPTPTQEVTV